VAGRFQARVSHRRVLLDIDLAAARHHRRLPPTLLLAALAFVGINGRFSDWPHHDDAHPSHRYTRMEKSGVMLAMERSAPLTGSDFYRFFQCPHWPYWERFGDKADRRPLTKEEEKRLADGLAHERDIIASQYGTPDDLSEVKDAEQGAARTLELMRAGVPIIYQGWLVDGDWSGRPDLLERQPGKSLLGDYFYVPVDVKRAHELKKSTCASFRFTQPCSSAYKVTFHPIQPSSMEMASVSPSTPPPFRVNSPRS
jgi:hypothetical protein